MFFKKVNIYLSIFYLLILLLFIIISSNYIISLSSDDYIYTFTPVHNTGLDHLMHNYFKSNGRWGQGLTNDYRLYNNRTISTAIVNVLLIIGIYLFSSRIFKKKGAITFTALFYITFLYSIADFFQATMYFPSLLSYTFGCALFLIMLYFLLKPDKKWNYYIAVLLLILINGLVESFSIVNTILFSGISVFLLIKNRKISVKYIILTLISIFSFLFIYYSPGNINRRNKYDSKVTSINFPEIVDLIINFLNNHLNLIFLVFILATAVLLLKFPKKAINNISFSRTLKVLITLLASTLFCIPLILSKMANVGFNSLNRLGITSSIYILLGTTVILILINPLKKYYKKASGDIILLALLLSLPIIISCNTNNVSKLFTQVLSEDLKNWNKEESNRREYLINSYNNTDKEVPPYKKDYYSLLHLFGKKDQLKIKKSVKVFTIFFNKKKLVTLNKELPDIRIINSIEKIKKGTLNYIEKNNFYSFYIADNVLIIESTNLKNKNNNLNFSYIDNNQKTISKEINFLKEQDKNKRFYNSAENNNFLGIFFDNDIKSFEIENIEVGDILEQSSFFEIKNREINPLLILNKKQKGRIKKKTTHVKEIGNTKTRVSFKLFLKENDELVLYYLQENKTYNAKNSQSKSIRGKDSLQDIHFLIDTKKGVLSNLRLDYATVLDQEIKIQEIKIENKKAYFIINQNQVKEYFNSPNLWNTEINKDQAKYGVKKHNNVIDSKLIGNKKLSAKLKTLQ